MDLFNPPDPTQAPGFPTPNPALLGDLVGAFLGEENAAREALQSGGVAGPRTSISALDKAMGGHLPPGVYTLLAAPGAGKTALCLQMAATCGTPALYVSAEMPRVELLRRLIAHFTGEYLGKLRGGQLEEAKLRALAAATARKAPQLALFDAHEAALNSNAGAGEVGASTAAIAARALALRERFQSRHVMVVIDSVTEWAPLATMGTPGNAQINEYSLAEAAVNGLKNLAATLHCPVIAIAHRHRAGQGKDADRLHSAKGTGRYEYISEAVWDLNRDPTIGPDKDGRTIAELSILKNRYGATGETIKLHFEGRVQKFTAFER